MDTAFRNSVGKILIKTLLTFSVPLFSVEGNVSIPSFETSMGLEKSGMDRFFSKEERKLFEFYKNHYSTILDKIYHPDKSSPEQIPHIVHFIWLGAAELPADSLEKMKSWKEHNPNWVFKFWTDDLSRSPPFSWMEQHSIEEWQNTLTFAYVAKSDNWAEKSDLLRYEILLNEGGVYVDHDVRCFRSLDPFCSQFMFLAMLEIPHYLPGVPVGIFPNNGLIGAQKNHPILKKTLQNCYGCWEEIEKKYPGPHLVHPRVLARTFWSFAKAVQELVADSSGANALLPAYFLFPSAIPSANEREKLSAHLLASHEFAGTWGEPQKK